jgi:hypothetical protein
MVADAPFTSPFRTRPTTLDPYFCGMAKPPPARHRRAMTKQLAHRRILATVLWLFAGWYLGNLAAFQFGLSDLFGPVLGLIAAVAVGGDPLGLLWNRAAPTRVIEQGSGTTSLSSD